MTRHGQYWNRHEPTAIRDGRVTIQAHDFFTPQPVNDADIFLLRYILHDWPNSKAIEILKRLRGAAVPGKTRVVVIDGVVQYACAVDQKQIRGAEDIAFEGSDKKTDAPAGLLPNLGRAGARNYLLDLTCVSHLHDSSVEIFLTRVQDVGEAQWARTNVGRPHPCDGSEWVED